MTLTLWIAAPALLLVGGWFILRGFARQQLRDVAAGAMFLVAAVALGAGLILDDPSGMFKLACVALAAGLALFAMLIIALLPAGYAEGE